MNRENFTLVYFLSRSLYLGIVFSLMFDFTGSDAIISCFLGTILGIGFIVLINKINLNNYYSKIIYFFLLLFLLLLDVNVVETFTSSFFLTNTPRIIIIIPFVLISLYLSFKEIKIIKYVSFIFFIISIILYLICMISLTNYFSIDNLTPFFTSSTDNIFKAALTFAALSTAPNILLIEEKIPLKNHILSYLIVSLINTSICTVVLGALTPNVAKIFSFPEYMVLKRIRIFEFIENIENIMASIWYIDLFILLSLLFKRVYKLLKNKNIFYIFVIFSILIISFTLVNDYYRVLFIYHYSALILTGFIILLSISLLFKKK